MDWKIGQAKQRFSEVVQNSAEEPQFIYNRENPVAVVISAEKYKEFREWDNKKNTMNLNDRFAELREILSEEKITLNFGKRKSRPNPFASTLDEISH